MLLIEASCVRCLDLNDLIKAFPCQKTRSKPFSYYYNAMLFMILMVIVMQIFICTTVPLYSDFRYVLFCCMTTVQLLSSPAIEKYKLQRQLNHDE